MKLFAFLELMKLRVNALVLVTTAAGFALGAGEPFPWALFWHTLAGTLLTAGGTCALNQCWEASIDAKMNRTRRRPLPSGRLKPAEAWVFSSLLSAAGLAYLAAAVHPLAFWLAAATLAVYVFVYTPLKPRTSLSTLIGAVSGAIPPMIGWAAAQNRLGPEAWVLFVILFLWQFPAFLSVAWIYRDDYARGGLPMLTVEDKSGGATSSQILLNVVGLTWVSIFPSLLGLTQAFYFAAALALGASFFAVAYFSSRPLPRLELHARKIFLASMAYLPLLFLFMVWDKAAAS